MNDSNKGSVARFAHAPALHALVFAAAVLGVAVAAAVKARHYEPKVDQAVLDGRMAHDFETQYDHDFPARSFAVSVWAAIDYVLFREAKSGVVIGDDGWLYTDEEFIVGERYAQRVERNLARIAATRDRLAAQGVKLVVAVVPAKARVYPEHLRRRTPPALHQNLYARARQALTRDGITQADLLTPLVDGKARGATFLRTDTHWTVRGAILAARAAARSVRSELPALDAPGEFTTSRDAPKPHRGDLLNFLPLDPYFAWLLPPAEMITPAHTESAAAGDLFGDTAAPRIALVGTSYSANPNWNFPGALKQALGEEIANYAKDGLGPFEPMQNYLDGADFAAAPPRLVIWEIPERYLAVDAQPSKAVAATAAPQPPANGPAGL
jgi:alginate O-acetyltransferase complex protein AlgJ